jgi:5'-nucleotidase
MKAVLFDLDDTLFDHKFSRVKALQALQLKFAQLQAVPIDELEIAHQKLLDANYSQVLEGSLSIVDGTTQRITQLCSQYGINLNSQEAQNTVDLYNQEYAKNRQAVPGSKELLTILRDYAKLGLITNGLIEPQMEKLRVCNIVKLLDYIVVSQTAGYTKPSKEIFEVALRHVNVKASDSVYVGDSWESDVLPAVSVGMKAIWLNRYGVECPDPRIATEINSFVGAKKELFI